MLITSFWGYAILPQYLRSVHGKNAKMNKYLPKISRPMPFTEDDYTLKTAKNARLGQATKFLSIGGFLIHILPFRNVWKCPVEGFGPATCWPNNRGRSFSCIMQGSKWSSTKFYVSRAISGKEKKPTTESFQNFLTKIIILPVNALVVCEMPITISNLKNIQISWSYQKKSPTLWRRHFCTRCFIN